MGQLIHDVLHGGGFKFPIKRRQYKGDSLTLRDLNQPFSSLVAPFCLNRCSVATIPVW